MIFIGYDQREALEAEVCENSIRKFWPEADIRYIALDDPDVKEVYARTFTTEHGRKIDDIDGRPFSTDFAFSRFLVPYLSKYEEWSLFCDCDFMFRADPREVFEMADPQYAVQVVKHNHVPNETTKMDNQVQTGYFRKNWSSLVLWNNAMNTRLTPEMVSTRTGSFLHQFGWLHAKRIGSIPEGWNWLEGISPTTDYEGDIKAVHFTLGSPAMKGYEDSPHADEWRSHGRNSSRRMAS